MIIKTIFSIILFIGAIILGIYSFYRKSEEEPIKFTVICASACLVVSVILGAFTIVPAGYSGVLVTTGKVNENVVAAGLHFRVPFVQDIVTINNRVQRTDVDGSGASKDLQTVTTNTSVNYHVLPLSSVSLYSNVGRDWDTVIIRPAVQECMKAVMARFTAEELITKRQEVGALMLTSISDKVKPYGIAVDSINILNMDFSEQFNAAIEAKQTAQQDALKAEQDLVRIQVEAQQKVVEAQADADANRIRSESITNEILMSEYLKKWDGKMPAVVGSDGQILDISALLGQ